MQVYLANSLSVCELSSIKMTSELSASSISSPKARYLSTAIIAGRLGVTPRSIRLWAECGEIPAIKIGRQWRFEQRAFEEWLAIRHQSTRSRLFRPSGTRLEK
jgi:excisionase family DNA binding protein